LTDYFIDSLLYGIHNDGFISLAVPNKTTTNEIALLVGSRNLYKYFDKEMPCDLTLFTNDPAPNITFSEYTNMIYANASLDIMCQPNSTTTEM